MSLKEELLEKRTYHLVEISKIDAAIKAIDAFDEGKVADASVLLAEDPDVYNNKSVYIPKEGTWIQQILAVIRHKNRFLHNNEIAEELYAFYPDKTKKQVRRRVSAVLSHALRDEKVKGLVNYNFSSSNQDWVWGKKDWLDENGNIKEEYQFKNLKKRGAKEPIEF